jgi:hypothetical protein
MSAPVWSVHGYAIVCDNGCIADANGVLPPALMNNADWAYFQDQLDLADITVLGRKSHDAAPNPKNRLRVVMTRNAAGLSRGKDCWLWNPADMRARDMLATLLPKGGRVAIPGGRGAFDLFLGFGYDGFHLSRKAGLALAGGVTLFGAPGAPEDIMAAAGLAPGDAIPIDPEDGVTLTIWAPMPEPTT